MIDTDKYEGHTEGPWIPYRLNMGGWTVGNLPLRWEEADKQLIADAPLLLAEVKRLRWGIYFALSYTRPTPHTDDPWVACRESIVEHLKSLIADIEPLSFIPKGDEEE
jgi:capsular polysaccharide biosynthesis protein